MYYDPQYTAQEDRGKKAAEEEWNYYSAGPVVQVCQA